VRCSYENEADRQFCDMCGSAPTHRAKAATAERNAAKATRRQMKGTTTAAAGKEKDAKRATAQEYTAIVHSTAREAKQAAAVKDDSEAPVWKPSLAQQIAIMRMPQLPSAASTMAGAEALPAGWEIDDEESSADLKQAACPQGADNRSWSTIVRDQEGKGKSWSTINTLKGMNAVQDMDTAEGTNLWDDAMARH